MRARPSGVVLSNSLCDLALVCFIHEKWVQPELNPTGCGTCPMVPIRVIVESRKAKSSGPPLQKPVSPISQG